MFYRHGVIQLHPRVVQWFPALSLTAPHVCMRFKAVLQPLCACMHVCPYRYSATAEKAATRAVDSAQTLIEQIKQGQLAALDSAPQEVKDSQWYKDFRGGVNNFNQSSEWPWCMTIA